MIYHTNSPETALQVTLYINKTHWESDQWVATCDGVTVTVVCPNDTEERCEDVVRAFCYGRSN